MNLEEAFLREIMDRPDDDAPRLIYSVWLHDHGGDCHRAALIRSQCELERLPVRDRRRKALEREARGLLKAHATEWKQPLKKAGIHGEWEFRRGFIEKATIAAHEFVEVAEELFRLAPLVRCI